MCIGINNVFVGHLPWQYSCTKLTVQLCCEVMNYELKCVGGVKEEGSSSNIFKLFQMVTLVTKILSTRECYTE